MNVMFEKSSAFGTVVAPPSKSVTHRALICGALSEKSVIENVDFCDDVLATFEALKTLGAKAEVSGNTVTIGGLNPFNIKEGLVVDCKESGSTLRFLIPLCMLTKTKVVFTGSKKLFERPLTVYERVFENEVLEIDRKNCKLTVTGPIKSGKYLVDASVSSQFLSGLLFALPLIKGDSQIIVRGKIASRPYLNLTVKLIENFGVDVEVYKRTIEVFGNQYFGNNDMVVEGDYSSAAGLAAFNMMGGKVEVEGLSINSLQGDKVFKDCFTMLKNDMATININDCPDLAPVLFAVAAVHNGGTFLGTNRLKAKESDRVKAMQEELAKFGIMLTEEEDSVTILKGEIKKPCDILNSHNDHRIVMALSLLLSLTGGQLKGAEAVKKSYPDYFKDIKKLGIKVKTK